MNLNDDDKESLVQHRLAKAEKTIDDVQFLINNQKLTLAINRIYYSAFYTVSALALKLDFSTSKHQQLIGWFNKNIIKENKMEKSYGQFLMTAFENRSTGDYDDFIEFQPSDVKALFQQLKLFYSKIKELIDHEQ